MRRVRKACPFLLCVVLMASCTAPPPDPEAAPARPNIVYLLADDLGYGDVSAYNPGGRVQTPHIDALAAEGMRFTDAHSPASVCTPARYALLTGRYGWRSRLPQGVLEGYGRALLDPAHTTVAALLQQQGYTTGVVGKWHLGLDWVIKEGHEAALAEAGAKINDVGMVQDMDPVHIDFTRPPTDGPLDHGFSYSFILPASLDMAPYVYLENDTLTALPSAHTPGNDLDTGYTEAFWRAGKMAPGFAFDQVLPTVRDKATAFIETHAPTGNPFFLYVPFAAPHTPWLPSADFQGQTEAGTYGDFVAMVDDAVGRILETLEAQGVAEHTLVIFASDNGPFWTPELVQTYGHRAVGPLRGMKADIWEGGHRVPLIARWPGHIAPGSISAALTSLTHLPATVADVLDVALPDGAAEDSRSLLPVLLGEADQVAGQEAVVHHSSGNMFAVRRGDWKLILGRGSGGFSEPRSYAPKAGEPQGQLYNLKTDLGETTNLYQTHPEQVAELTAVLARIKGNP